MKHAAAVSQLVAEPLARAAIKSQNLPNRQSTITRAQVSLAIVQGRLRAKLICSPVNRFFGMTHLLPSENVPDNLPSVRTSFAGQDQVSIPQSTVVHE